MRWIDINLPEPGTNQNLDTLISQAKAELARIPALQERDGLDAVTVVGQITVVGARLFQAVQTVDPGAFSPDRKAGDREHPALDQPDHDHLLGFHLVCDPEWLGLPWTWLHNGIAFVLEKHPVCASASGSRLPEGHLSRPWMQRLKRSHFLVGEDGSSALKSIFAQVRSPETQLPEMLFVPGHTDRQMRRMIYREAEAIIGAIETGFQGEQLIKIQIPENALTPTTLCTQGLMYQMIHFAGPTSHPARSDDADGEYWMNRLIEETARTGERELEDAMGIEGEVLGVDPITSLLDDISDRFDEDGPPAESVSASGMAAGESQESGRGLTIRPVSGPEDLSERSWLLDDGPVEPENLGRSGHLPPLVFSNSYRAMPELGLRFTRAGASTFIGPVLPLYSRPARIFVGYAYSALGQGWSAGAALWKAARDTRDELGDDHPAWLSYGIQGYGNLSLQFL